MQKVHRNLGGVCASCPSTDELELDHVDPSLKNGETVSEAEVRAARGETDNLQLLCHDCHVRKTNRERGITLTNEQLGERIGVTHSMASRIRNGHRLPGTQTLRAIHREFGIPLDDLMDAHGKGPEEFGQLLTSRLKELNGAPT